MKKSLFVVGILFLVFILNFVSSAAYPAPFVFCQPEPIQCPSEYDNTDNMNMQAFYNNGNKISASITIVDNCGKEHTCIKVISPSPIASKMGNIQSNLQFKMGSSTGITSSVSGEVKSLASGSDSLYVLDDFALRQELDNPLEFKKKEDCNKSNGCYFEGDCFLTEDIINSNYCFKGEFIPQKSWGNLCEQDFECLEGFCFEGKCYRGGKDNYLKNKNKELENKLENLENAINRKDNATKINSITGAVVDNSLKKQSWIVRIWKKFFG